MIGSGSKAVTSILALTLALGEVADAQPPTPVEVERSYRKALGDLADGWVDQAVTRVAILQDESSPRCLQAVELETAKRLAEAEPETILGLALLRLAVHQEVYLSWSESGSLFGFERVSINGLRELGDLYVETSRHGAARSTVAGLLTYLAEIVAATRSAQRLDTARFLLEDALQLDPDHPAALHSMAVNLELRGRPGQALAYLERLLDLEPGNAGSRLRRAVVTLKAGRTERARVLLEELAVEAPDWVRDLATQELARLHQAAGRDEEAEAVIRRGLESLPAEKLSLQLAALLDPGWTDSWMALAGWLTAPQADAGPSARWIYEDGAKAEVDALRRELGTAVSERAPALRRGLGQLPEPGAEDPKMRTACR